MKRAVEIQARELAKKYRAFALTDAGKEMLRVVKAKAATMTWEQKRNYLLRYPLDSIPKHLKEKYKLDDDPLTDMRDFVEAWENGNFVAKTVEAQRTVDRTAELLKKFLGASETGEA